MRQRHAILLVATALVPAILPAQRLEFGAAVWGAGAKVRSVNRDVREALTGPYLGFDAHLQRGRVGLRLGYGQGSLDPDTAGPPQRDYVDGFLLLTGSPVTGLDLGVGPYARAYVRSDEGTQRWLYWTLRARYQAEIVLPVVEGFAEVWTSFAASVNVQDSFDGARGGTVGVLWTVTRFRGSPVKLRLSYAIDEGRLASGARRETVELTTLAIGLGRI